jgi:hypothetical protein
MTKKSVELEMVAESHFFIRPALVNTLKRMKISQDAKLHRFVSESHQTYYDMWTSGFNHRFYDMTTMIRLASVVEQELRGSYMRLKGYSNLINLKNDPDYKRGVFQRIMPWDSGKGSAQALFQKEGCVLNDITNVLQAREVMLHRHLYAHNLGLIDEEYILKWLKLTGEDLKLLPSFVLAYQEEDCYWFRPLDNINKYIEDLRAFVTALP